MKKHISESLKYRAAFPFLTACQQLWQNYSETLNHKVCFQISVARFTCTTWQFARANTTKLVKAFSLKWGGLTNAKSSGHTARVFGCTSKNATLWVYICVHMWGHACMHYRHTHTPVCLSTYVCRALPDWKQLELCPQGQAVHVVTGWHHHRVA